MKICGVCGLKTSGAGVFKLPEDPVKVKEWSTALGIDVSTFSKSKGVCYIHFKKCDLKTFGNGENGRLTLKSGKLYSSTKITAKLAVGFPDQETTTQ